MITSRITRLCKDYTKIENYEQAVNDPDKIWVLHHRLEIYFSMNELKTLNMYYNRPPEELIFMTRAEHNSLHHKGKKLSESHRKALYKGEKGKYYRDEEYRQKQSEALKKYYQNLRRESQH